MCQSPWVLTPHQTTNTLILQLLSGCSNGAITFSFFFGLTILKTFNLILIGWLIKFSVQTFQAITLEGVIIIGGEHQFLGHCLIPLDP